MDGFGIFLDRPGVIEIVDVYPATLRQLAVAGLGHEPTLLITNCDLLPAKQVIET